MVHDSISYIVDGSCLRIAYGKGLYHRLHLISTETKWRPTMYLRDDKLKQYTKEEVKKIYDKFIKRLKECSVHKQAVLLANNPGEIIVRDEGAFLRCFDKGDMMGFLHIPEKMMDDLKDRLTADFITNITKEVFELDADFGLYYCGSLCPPEANFADYYFNWSSLEIRTKTKFEAQSLEEQKEELQESLAITEQALRGSQEYVQRMTKKHHHLEKKFKKLEKEKSQLLEEMNQLMKENTRQLKEEVKTLKEQQPKKTTDETAGQQSTA